MTHQLEDW